MAKTFIIEITLANNNKNFTTVKAENELEALDKVNETYKKRNMRIYDLKVVG